MSHRIRLCLAKSHHVTSRHITSHHVTSYVNGKLERPMWRQALWCLVMLVILVMSCHVMSCHVMSCRVVSCCVVSCHVMSCRVVSCGVVTHRVMSCRVVPSPACCGTMQYNTLRCKMLQLVPTLSVRLEIQSFVKRSLGQILDSLSSRLLKMGWSCEGTQRARMSRTVCHRIRMDFYRSTWVRTNGINTNRASARVLLFGRLGEKIRPGRSRLGK